MNDSMVYGPVLNAAYVAATTGTIAKKKTKNQQQNTRKLQRKSRIALDSQERREEEASMSQTAQ